jgi:DNA-binding CsgD family transcriptional regulator
MRLSGLFHFKKSRKYPIRRDSEGRSLRARCFELFAGGKRPKTVAEELKMKEPTVGRYFKDWQRLGPDFNRQYSFVKGLLKKDAPDREKNIEILSKMLGIEKEEFEAILSRPHGLRRFLTGKLYFPINKDIDRKLHVALKLAVLISDHVIMNGGNFEDVCHALRRYMQANKRYREDVEADIKEWNKDMELIHAILATDLEKEKEKRTEPDRLSEKERGVILRWAVEREMKSTEVLYWFRIGVLKAGGLTEEQAREKIYQDLVEKGDLNKAKMMREFQDKVHPLGDNDKTT